MGEPRVMVNIGWKGGFLREEGMPKILREEQKVFL
jgi:hypothetical protein